MSEVKYVNGFKPFIRKNKDAVKSLLIEPYCEQNDEDNPQSGFKDGLSRFKFIILTDKPCSFNMRFMSDTGDNYLSFREAFQYAKSQIVGARFAPKVGNNSPAFTYVFKKGRGLEGKTAAEVLKANFQNGRRDLESQKEYLKASCSGKKWAEDIVSIIDEALALTPEDVSKAEEITAIPLYDSGLRVLENDTKKAGDGKTDISKVYQGKITCISSAEEPVKVEIYSCYSSTKKVNALTCATFAVKENEMKEEFSLTYNEALRMFEELDTYYEMKKRDVYAKGDKIASELQKKEAQERKKQNNSAKTQKPEQSAKEATQPPKGNVPDSKENIPEKTATLKVYAKTPIVERTSAPGDFSMQGINNDKTVNIVFQKTAVEKMGKDVFKKMVERSKDNTTPLSFTANFNEIVENGRTVYQFVSFSTAA